MKVNIFNFRVSKSNTKNRLLDMNNFVSFDICSCIHVILPSMK